MAIFKSNPEKAVQRDIDAATTNRARLSAKLAESEEAVARHAAAAKQAALTGDDTELDRAEVSLWAAQDRSTSLKTALSDVEQQLAALERKKAEIADQKVLAQTAAEIELVVRNMTEAAVEFDTAAARLSEHTARAVPWLWEVRGLNDFVLWSDMGFAKVSASRTIKPALVLQFSKGHYPSGPACHQIGDMIQLRHAGNRPSHSERILGALPACRRPNPGVVRDRRQGALSQPGRNKAAVRQHRRFRGRQPSHLRSRRQQISADRPRVICLWPRAREVHRHSFRIRPHRSGDRIIAKKLIRPIRSEADYDAALNEIERYFENEPKSGTPEADRFDLLALIIEDYERKRWTIEPPDTIDAIRYRMETSG